MSDPEKKKILKRIEKLQAFAQAALDEASAVRLMLLESGVSSSPQKGKDKKAALTVLKNRRSKTNPNN